MKKKKNRRNQIDNYQVYKEEFHFSIFLYKVVIILFDFFQRFFQLFLQ